MKKFFYVSMLVLAGVFAVSCGSDDKSAPTPTPAPTIEEKIEGKWYVYKTTFVGENTGETEVHIFQGECESKNGLTFIKGAVAMKGTLNVVNAEFNTDQGTCLEESLVGTYEFEPNNKLKLLVGDELLNVDYIYNESAKTLTFSFYQEAEQDGEYVIEGGTTTFELKRTQNN